MENNAQEKKKANAAAFGYRLFFVWFVLFGRFSLPHVHSHCFLNTDIVILQIFFNLSVAFWFLRHKTTH